MGRKIFVSYKYADNQVENLSGQMNSTVRDYVTKIEKLFESTDHIYKGEHDNEDLSKLSEETIWNKLKNRIYDSSLTIILISPGMKEENKPEKEQWIPWEISYSLKEISRKNSIGQSVTSQSNAMLAVVLPDQNGSYSYYLETMNCCSNQCIRHHTERIFSIIRNNKFNLLEAQKSNCPDGSTVWSGPCSYIDAVKWHDFLRTYNYIIAESYNRQKNIDAYKIQKEI